MSSCSAPFFPSLIPTLRPSPNIFHSHIQTLPSFCPSLIPPSLLLVLILFHSSSCNFPPFVFFLSPPNLNFFYYLSKLAVEEKETAFEDLRAGHRSCSHLGFAKRKKSKGCREKQKRRGDGRRFERCCDSGEGGSKGRKAPLSLKEGKTRKVKGLITTIQQLIYSYSCCWKQ